MKTKYKSGYWSSLKGRITMMFIILAAVMEGLLLVYWITVLEPRLEAGVESNIRSLAQSQTLALSTRLSEPDIDKDQVVRLMETLLLLKDPLSGMPLVLSVELEMDYDAVDAEPESLDLVSSITGGPGQGIWGYEVEVPVFSNETNELLGIARFYGSKAFFLRVKKDVQKGFLIGTVYILVLLFLSWWSVIILLRPLNELARMLSRRSGDANKSLPRLKGVVSNEVQLIKSALDDLFSRIRKDTSNLVALNVILSTQQETSLDAILVLDATDRQVLSNRQFFKMWRIPKDIAPSMIKEQALDLILDRLAMPDLFHDKMVNLNEHPEEKSHGELVLKDGRIVDHYSSPMFDPEQNHLGRVWYFRDITEKKLSEEALKQNFNQLKAIYNTLPVIVWSADENGIFTLSEGRELAALGLQPAEVVGLSAFDLYQDNSLIIENLKKALKGEYCEYETEVSGTVFDTFLTPFYNDDDKVAGLYGLAINITEKKLVEAELRSLRNYLANIIDSMPSVLVGVDRDGQVTQWNRKAQQVTGISPESAKGQPLHKAFPVLSDKLESVRQAINMRQICSDPRQARKEEDQTRYEDVTIYPLVANGVEGAVIRIDDVTEQVRLEEMMVQSEKMLSVGGLAAGMAHEINNPLAGIMQTAQVLKSRLNDPNMPANLRAAEASGVSMENLNVFMEKRGIFRMVDAINESGKRMAGIVDNMLSFARKTDASVSSHHMGQLMDKIIELASTDFDLKKQYDFKTIKIIKEYEENLPMVPCEGTKIQQVILNILRNGAQAMQSEHAAKDVPPCFILRISVENENAMLRIEIEDNGPGMDDATCKRVFEPFFTTKAVGVGTGLGLSVSYFIITENHGGDMQVVSQIGSGTTFIIRLPLEGKM
ncbi:PAS domain-containing sensor histidine kinase [Desulfospira joergensenii]|uniref:PAS domain-containing sensor histidine kinase n=1 Tax=Desulfospira joergensenii TaxID=53329 RepID=UPI0003B45577|nr:PAS domain S-box protein [Desulfospira joergensenii]